MNREPLVCLPALLTPAAAPSAAADDVRFVLGIDGGATKTLAAVLDLRRGELHLGHGGPSNQDAVGVHAATDALLGAADEAIAAAGAAGREGVHAAVLAVAGTDTGAVEAQVRANCPAQWIVVNDVVGAWATATGAQAGVGVISGTGSNVFGVGADGRAWRTGGWGHILGDEGSGYWFGLQALRAALHDRDASGPPTALGDAAVELFGAPSVEALAPLLYAKPLSKSEIAAFAVHTAHLAEQGDAVARAIYAEGAELLAGQVAAVIAQTGLAGAFPIGLIGSAFKAGAVFCEPFEHALGAVAPDASIAPVEMAPVGGSLLLAARACGAADVVGDGELERLLDAALARAAS